jgi:glycosyltransferase involved in cell wall biosynthesis
MQMNDVLIFPTLLDAFGMVISESMSQGTPVITTTSSGGPELINDKQDGWIIEPGQSESIKRTIEEILLNRGIIEEFGQKALIKANDRTWGSYQLDICSKILNRE